MSTNKQYSESKILEVLKEYNSGVSGLEVCRKYNIAKSTLYKWSNKYRDMSLSDISKLKILAEENRKLKELCANLSLDNLILKESLQKKF
ncbi:MAG: transposase [Proteobacteria bacterium]|nr:transposase [Pseudomonadota bacterium]